MISNGLHYRAQPLRRNPPRAPDAGRRPWPQHRSRDPGHPGRDREATAAAEAGNRSCRALPAFGRRRSRDRARPGAGRAPRPRMILLDTNVVSETMRRSPDRTVVAWLDAQAAETLHLSAVSLVELLFGIASLPDGRRKVELGLALG